MTHTVKCHGNICHGNISYLAQTEILRYVRTYRHKAHQESDSPGEHTQRKKDRIRLFWKSSPKKTLRNTCTVPCWALSQTSQDGRTLHPEDDQHCAACIQWHTENLSFDSVLPKHRAKLNTATMIKFETSSVQYGYWEHAVTSKINYLFLGGFRYVDSVPLTDHLPFVWNLPQMPQFSNNQLHYLKWFPPNVARLWVAFPRLQHSDKKLSTRHVSFLFFSFFFFISP